VPNQNNIALPVQNGCGIYSLNITSHISTH
jgi:hypothetical protein